MADNNKREPEGKRTDWRVLIVLAVVALVVLVLFLVFDIGYGTAPDTTSGGPDADYAAPQSPEETAPTTPQN